VIRNRDRQIGCGQPVLPRYERITFHKELISLPGKPLAAFVCPGHPLLDATIDLILERYRDLLRRGAVLVDPREDSPEEMRVLFYIEDTIQDARTDRQGHRRIVARQMQFVEMNKAGQMQTAGYAPYLDYRPVSQEERHVIERELAAEWLKEGLEDKARSFAIEQLVPKQFDEIKRFKEELVARTMSAVKDRLTKEINYWDHRAEELKAQELAGRPNARINSGKARERANELEARLNKRLQELEQERRLSPLPPVVAGGALVIPIAMLQQLQGQSQVQPARNAKDTQRIERLAMEAVIALERDQGHEPKDVSADKCGYDVESHIPAEGRLLFIEVKGRVVGASTVTVTKNEILTGLNKPDSFILAIVEVDGDVAKKPVYIRQSFKKELDFGVTSVNYSLPELMTLAKASR